MGRYYTRLEGKLYIYVTKNDLMMNIDLFPPELNLSQPDDYEGIKDKVVVLESKDKGSIDKAEMILILNGFKRGKHSLEVLNHYSTVGDESVIEDDVSITPTHYREEYEEDDSKVEDFDVIIPKFPSVPFDRIENDSNGNEVQRQTKYDTKGREISGDISSQEWRPADEEELIRTLKECMESKGFKALFNDVSEVRQPRLLKDEPRAPSQQVNEALTLLLSELVGQLTELIREIRQLKKELKPESSLYELVKNLNMYLRDQIETNDSMIDKSGRERDTPSRKKERKIPDELIELLIKSKENETGSMR